MADFLALWSAANTVALESGHWQLRIFNQLLYFVAIF